MSGETPNLISRPAKRLSANILMRYAARPVPRYTSYPTAVQFSDAVGPVDYAGWLGQLPTPEQPNGQISLYAHIPFCDTLCWFCGCHTKVTQRYEPVARYLGFLKREIDLVAAAAGERPAKHLHWGGGSPTILTPDDTLDLARHTLRRFPLTANGEFAVEIDPRGLSRESIQALAEAGVNRASLGVQDLDGRVQKAVNRHQPLEETERCVEWLREAGIGRINIDLIYGLPHQTVDGVAETAETVVRRLKPQRLAVFGYAHVPWMKRHMRLIDEAALPGGMERWRQAEAMAEALTQAGYAAIGLDHYALPDDDMAQAAAQGRLRRNFQGYTTDAASNLIGLGASSIGSLPGGFVQNTVPLDRYAAAIENGGLATAKGLAVAGEDRLRGAVIEKLMCDMAVDVAAVATERQERPDDLSAAMEALAPLVADGLVFRDGWKLEVPAEARSLVRLVAAAFDRYLPPPMPSGQQRHARAV